MFYKHGHAISSVDPQKAEQLHQYGFKYTKRNIDNKEVFVFIQTNELMKELNSKFEQCYKIHLLP